MGEIDYDGKRDCLVYVESQEHYRTGNDGSDDEDSDDGSGDQDSEGDKSDENVE